MNKSFVTTDCTLTWLFEMQVELFYLRRNTLRQAQKVHVTHCSLSHVSTRMSTGFWIFLQENMLDWRPAGEDCSSGGLPRAGPQSSKRLLRRGWFSDAIFPHQKCWCSAFFFLVHACICAKSLQSCLFATPWTVAHQAPLSLACSGQEYWSGLPCSPFFSLIPV